MESAPNLSQGFLSASSLALYVEMNKKSVHSYFSKALFIDDETPT
jgi:hypothetical protein